MALRDRRLLSFAREMGRDPTRAESILWSYLRGKQFGVRFRRQEPVGPFIADFACIGRKLIVEVDGDSHIDLARDERRDAWFLDRGWFVLRFWDGDVISDINDILEIIQMALDDPSSVEDPMNRNP